MSSTGWTVAALAVSVSIATWAAALAQPSGTGTSPADGSAASPAPATRPAAAQPAEQLLSQMLRPAEQAARPLTPAPQTDLRDATSGRGAAVPNAPSLPLLREGTFVVDRTGRLLRTEDGFGFDFVFEADGRTLRDPPMMILPNSRLQVMEDAVRNSSRNLRFRITGIVTEYRGRNGILIEKAVVVPDVVQNN